MTAVLGHNGQFATVRAAMDSGRLHHAWLLHGPKGVGKGSFARAIAARMLAEASPTPPDDHGFMLAEDHPTARLITARSHPDYVLVEREVWNKANDRLVPYADRDTGDVPARNIRVLQVRWLNAIFALAPALSARRVVILDSVDDMERPAANALLKMLEEPPTDTVFLLVSHVPGRLLPTIRSRCRSLAFTGLQDDVMADVLSNLAPDLDQITRAVVVALANGAPGSALSVIAADVPGIDAVLREIAATGDPHNVLRLDLANQLALKAALPRYEAFLQRAPAFIATQTRTRHGASLATGLAAWEAARELADVAIAQSLPPESVVFEIAGRVAALAPKDMHAKA